VPPIVLKLLMMRLRQVVLPYILVRASETQGRDGDNFGLRPHTSFGWRVVLSHAIRGKVRVYTPIFVDYQKLNVKTVRRYNSPPKVVVNFALSCTL
jgi:hypothetical protein